jgi:hypothetical protein
MAWRPCFTEDELRAAGALDCPPEFRKSLGGGRKAQRRVEEQLDLFAGLADKDDPTHEEEEPAPDELDSDELDSDESDDELD